MTLIVVPPPGPVFRVGEAYPDSPFQAQGLVKVLCQRLLFLTV